MQNINSEINNIKTIFSAYLSENDKLFDEALYPKYMQDISDIHWTPIVVAKKAAELLAAYGANQILDIGSGLGKFCTIGAIHTKAIFHGIEIRKELHEISEAMASLLKLDNLLFINQNITETDFNQFDGFYYFNPFLENLHPINRIDNQLTLESELFKKYTNYVRGQFAKLPNGTKVVTYCSDQDILPKGYILKESHFNHRLKLWVKPC